LFGVEAEPDGSLLLAGGTAGVFLLKETKGTWRETWNWETLGFQSGDMAAAVAAERDPYGRVDLVLAAEPGKKRIFLAEARSHEVKIRWEFPLALPPRRVRLCPDTGNFLVLSSDSPQSKVWRLEEVDFRKDKSVWGFGSASGSLHLADAIRLKNGWTVVSDLASARVAAFDRKGKKVWVQTLIPSLVGPLEKFPLAVERTKTGAFLLAAPSESNGSTYVFRLKPSTGEIVGQWSAAPGQGVASPWPAMDSISGYPQGARLAR
jgi:hypothetical protein